MLPPGSQAACRDISEAFRTIPLHPSQWNGAVVRLSNAQDIYAVDTCAMFGSRACPGVHGNVADAAADLMRFCGIGPLAKWVDDHIFFRVLCVHLTEFNERRRAARERIRGRQHMRGRIWYPGGTLPDDSVEEFVEDFAFDISDLSSTSPRSEDDRRFTYAFADIDSLSARLGYVWNAEKDAPFASTTVYTGFLWDLASRTVSLPTPKREKYIAAIAEFRTARRHVLCDIQKLYGKLLHATSVIQCGRAYLTHLEAALSLSHGSPYVPRTPHRDTVTDLDWWTTRLSDAALCSRSIPAPVPVRDIAAYSDASSGFGIAVVIGNRWRAWRLVGAWKSQGRDIQWAEAVGFELLVRIVTAAAAAAAVDPFHFKAWGDNQAVVEGWRKHSSHNGAVNRVFRRLHEHLAETQFTVHARCHLSAYALVHANTIVDTSKVRQILPMDRLGATTRATEGCSLPFSSPTTYSASSSTSTRPAAFAPPQALFPSLNSRLQRPRDVSSSTAYSSAPATNSSTTSPIGGRTTRPLAELPPRFAPYANSRPRPYKPHLHPSPSVLRPDCTARERLIKWRPAHTPFFELESPEDRKRIADILALGFSDGTLQTYGSGLLTFHVFCDGRSVAEALRAPASRSLISLFISSLAGLYSASSITNYLAGLRAWHTINRLAWNADPREVELMIRGATTAAPERPAQRPPFTVELLHTVLGQLDVNIPLDVACYAALTSCFWGTARVGEIVVPNRKSFSPAVHLTPVNVSESTDRDNNSVIVLHVPRTKCSQVHGEDIYFATQPGLADPRRALERQLEVNMPTATSHLFAYKGSKGKLLPLTRDKFLGRLKSAAAAASVRLPPGHSIRIGSTTEYLLRGVPFDVMRAKGRWASDAFLKYLRKHAEIMAPYIQANPALLAEFIRLAMPPVR